MIVATYLTFILCKHVNQNCIGVRWHTTREAIGDALSFRNLAMIYNHAEANPLEKTSGGLIGILDSIIKSIQFSASSQNSCM